MRITLLLLAIASVISPLYAQFTDFPSYEEIETIIQDESSDYYYPDLLQRYVSGDSTMNTMEQIYVYYGYIFQEGYNPVDPSVHLATLKNDMFFDQSSMPDYGALIALTYSMLDDNPFDFQALTHLLYFLQKIEDEDNAKIIKTRLDCIIHAILQSSNGVSMDNPYLITHGNHYQAIIIHKNLTYLGEQTTVENTQYLKVRDIEQNEFMLYFDIEPVFQYMSNM